MKQDLLPEMSQSAAKSQCETQDLVLSLFPGIGLLDRGFEAIGYCVVRGPDILWGGDIRKFHPRPGHWAGVIGGPPCQDFSNARRAEPTGEGMELVGEYLRTITEAAPKWWLMENVAGSPDVELPGYHVQRFTLDASHLGSRQHRLRKFHYGWLPGESHPMMLERVTSQETPGASQPTCMATEGRRANRRSWEDFCELQGLPRDFDLPSFTVAGKYRAVGNGVPFEMALALAGAVCHARQRHVTPLRLCACGCGRYVMGKAITASAGCRKREERRRITENTLDSLPSYSLSICNNSTEPD